MRYAAVSDMGRKRDANEDAFLAEPPLFAVADGLGGHQAGEVASGRAIDIVRRRVLEQDSITPGTLVDAVLTANRDVFLTAKANAQLEGMGTTLTTLYIRDDAAILAHVGDSRAYRLRQGVFAQLTTDHTLIQSLLDRGRIDPEDARHHPLRTALTKAVGTAPHLAVDAHEFLVEPGDLYLLCSDGLTTVVTDDDIIALLDDLNDLEAVASRLVDAANARGGPDNITIVLVEITLD